MATKHLKTKDFDDIQELLKAGVKQKEIAERYGLLQSDVSRLKSGKTYEFYPYLKIYGVSAKTKTLLANIASNKGLTLNYYVKHLFQDIISQTPEHLKQPPRKD